MTPDAESRAGLDRWDLLAGLGWGSLTTVSLGPGALLLVLGARLSGVDPFLFSELDVDVLTWLIPLQVAASLGGVGALAYLIVRALRGRSGTRGRLTPLDQAVVIAGLGWFLTLLLLTPAGWIPRLLHVALVLGAAAGFPILIARWLGVRPAGVWEAQVCGGVFGLLGGYLAGRLLGIGSPLLAGLVLVLLPAFMCGGSVVMLRSLLRASHGSLDANAEQA